MNLVFHISEDGSEIECDDTPCIICIFNKAEYLDKERSYENSSKEFTVYCDFK